MSLSTPNNNVGHLDRMIFRFGNSNAFNTSLRYRYSTEHHVDPNDPSIDSRVRAYRESRRRLRRTKGFNGKKVESKLLPSRGQKNTSTSFHLGTFGSVLADTYTIAPVSLCRLHVSTDRHLSCFHDFPSLTN